MQGRLSPMVNGQIQAFPWHHWESEFLIAAKHSFTKIEWTLDQERLHENPLMTEDGQEIINGLLSNYNLEIPSITGDCFMQDPFWKAKGNKKKLLENDFFAIVNSCKKVGVSIIVIPLVDNGRLSNKAQENYLVDFFDDHIEFIQSKDILITFESDFEPKALSDYINRLDAGVFGINYDIGNSAALGYDPKSEFKEYGSRIYNVHIKDRKYLGNTVPLLEGDANFDLVFHELKKIDYQGNLVLQTARAIDDNHISPLLKYREMTLKWGYESGVL